MKIFKAIISTALIVALVFVGIVAYDYIDSSDLEIASSILFNRYGFIRGENLSGISIFKKDANVKYTDNKSLYIENSEFNDASFIKNISVTPNTVYKVSCMVKTENVEREVGNKNAGTNISIIDSTEKSESLIGTNDWTELTLYFNSKDRTEVQIGLRLGAYDGYAKGKCWFSDFKIEQGVQEEDNTWNMLCLIYKNIDVDLTNNGATKNIKISMSDDDIKVAKTQMKRFQNSINEMSNGKIQITYDVIVVDTPITNLTYNTDNGYYIDPGDIENDLNKYLSYDEYDHIFAVCRLTDEEANMYVDVKDWIGLGSMDYTGIGYSLVRMPDSRSNYGYQYNSNVQFPEEVFLHEFLHTLERNQKESGYDVVDLHAYKNYGYQTDSKLGLKQWYADYMNKQIKYGDGLVGLEDCVFVQKPVHKSDFINSIVIDECI